jgi:hypothetical protein
MFLRKIDRLSLDHRVIFQSTDMAARTSDLTLLFFVAALLTFSQVSKAKLSP